jgi:glycosyltransferase involved in cell wall biosynthesis
MPDLSPAAPDGGPMVAVIVPTFDDGDTLGETVASIQRERTQHELVVVDDGSTEPGSLAVLEGLERDGVTVIHQPNQGPSVATMTGLSATTAPYVMRMDADDLLEPGALAELLQALDDTPDAAVAWGDVQTFGLTTFQIPTAPTFDPWLLTYVNCIPGAGCLLRRSAVVEAGGLQLRDGYEDWDLWMALAERGWDGVYVRRIAFRYRRDERGRQAASVAGATDHYETLRLRHPALFASRAANRTKTRAPRALKTSVSVVEALPGVPRLARIQLCELFTHLLWNGGLGVTATMVRQTVAWRLAARRRAKTTASGSDGD